MKFDVKKTILAASVTACLVGAGAANATQVTVKFTKPAKVVMTKTTGTYTLPTIVDDTTQPVTINFNNSGSTVTGVYSTPDGHICTFKVTHKLVSSGGTLIPQFDKSAVSSGTGSAYSCSANFGSVKYVAPYDYTITFGML